MIKSLIRSVNAEWQRESSKGLNLHYVLHWQCLHFSMCENFMRRTKKTQKHSYYCHMTGNSICNSVLMEENWHLVLHFMKPSNLPFRL